MNMLKQINNKLTKQSIKRNDILLNVNDEIQKKD